MGEHPSAKSFGIWEGIVSYMVSNLLVFTCLGSVALGKFVLQTASESSEKEGYY